MEYDSPTSLYHTYARYFSPRLQRFLSEDPLQFGGGDVNLFAYARNDPINHVDPSGLQGMPEGPAPFGPPPPAPPGPAGYPGDGSGDYANAEDYAAANTGAFLGDTPDGILDSMSDLSPGVLSISVFGGVGSSQLNGGAAGLQLAQTGSVGAAGVPQSQIPYTQSRCPCGCSACGTRRMLVTGYSNDYESTGKNSGDPGYGVTSSGTKAGPGTIATPSRYPYGTHMYVPGYGCGSVEDRGGAIRRNHIDLWFPTPQEAHEWGNPRLPVAVCH